MLTPQNLDALPWMPESCAYRVLHEGGELPTGIRLSMATGTGPAHAGISVAGASFQRSRSRSPT